MTIVVTTYTTSLVGTTRREVRCEHCGCHYAYTATRRAEASAHSAARARRDAPKSLQRSLTRAVDPVPCPACHWLQADMVREIRRRHHRWANKASLFSLAGAAATLAIGLPISVEFRRSWYRHLGPDAYRILSFAAGLLLSLLLFTTRLLLARRLRPNARHPEPPPPIPGAPVAERLDPPSPTSPTPATSQATDPTADPTSPTLPYRTPLPPGGWITIQLNDVTCPPYCHLCLTPTDRTRRPFFNPRLRRLHLPTCPRCLSKTSRRTGTIVLTSALATGLLAAVPLLLWTDTWYNFTRLELASYALGITIAAVLLDRFLGPATYRRFSPDLNTTDLRFRNPDYAHLFLTANAPSVQRPPYSS